MNDNNTHTEALVRKMEGFLNLLISSSTGTSYSDDEYKRARKEVLDEPILSSLMPRFVHTYRDIGSYWQHIKKQSNNYQGRRDYLHGLFDPILTRLESGLTSPAAQNSHNTLAVIGSPHVQDAWRSAYARQETDPDGAITSARGLLESVCKFILDKASETYDDAWDLPKLYKTAAKKLNLAPDQHADPIVKQILGGCHSVVDGLGAFRNKYGDAHGKGASSTLPSTRHSALAVNLAGSVATFLIQTYEEKGIKK